MSLREYGGEDALEHLFLTHESPTDLLEKLRLGGSKTGEEFDAAKDLVVAALGKSVYHDTRLQWWGVLEGETCFGIGFQWKDDWVGEVVGPGPMEGDLFPHCKAAAQLNECAKSKPSSECRKEIELPDVWND